MSSRAVILAGGRGSRLAPFTTVVPKPLVPIGDRPILDIVVRQLKAAGFRELTIAVGHLAYLIRAVFGDGSAHGVLIRYYEEERALGTAGALAFIDGLDETFLMMNGDVLTSLDYGAFLDAHRAAGNALTIATHRRVVDTDYGVLHVDDLVGDTQRVVGYEEKPRLPYTVSMGVYAVEPTVTGYVPRDRPYDLPDLVLALLAAAEPVGSYPFDGYWLDIGRHEDLERAQVEFPEMQEALLPREEPL